MYRGKYVLFTPIQPLMHTIPTTQEQWVIQWDKDKTIVKLPLKLQTFDIKINGEFKNNQPGFITDQPLYASKSKKNNCMHYDNLEVLAPLQKKENAPEVRLFVAS